MKFHHIFLIGLNLLVSQTYSLYICTAADYVYFPHLLNFIGSLHKNNRDIEKLLIFNLGLSKDQIQHLRRIEKVEVNEVEKKHPDILKSFKVHPNGKSVPGWYAWKPVVIKQALDICPYVLWIDAGATILKSLNPLTDYIQEHGYFLTTIGDDAYEDDRPYTHTIASQTTRYIREKFNLDSAEFKHILDKEAVTACIIGVSRSNKEDFIIPLYDLAADLRNFEDDGTAPRGFGGARYEQALLGIIAYKKNLKVFRQAYKQEKPMQLHVKNVMHPFYVTWDRQYVNDKTCIYSSRWDLQNAQHYKSYIRYSRAL